MLDYIQKYFFWDLKVSRLLVEFCLLIDDNSSRDLLLLLQVLLDLGIFESLSVLKVGQAAGQHLVAQFVDYFFLRVVQHFA